MTDYLSALKAAQEKVKRFSDALLVDPTNEVLAGKYVRAGRDLERALVENTDELIALIEAAKGAMELRSHSDPSLDDADIQELRAALAALDAKVGE